MIIFRGFFLGFRFYAKLYSEDLPSIIMNVAHLGTNEKLNLKILFVYHIVFRSQVFKFSV